MHFKCVAWHRGPRSSAAKAQASAAALCSELGHAPGGYILGHAGREEALGEALTAALAGLGTEEALTRLRGLEPPLPCCSMLGAPGFIEARPAQDPFCLSLRTLKRHMPNSGHSFAAGEGA